MCSLNLCLPCTMAAQQMLVPSALPGRPAASSWLTYMHDSQLKSVHLEQLAQQQPLTWAAPTLLACPAPQRCSRRCCCQSCLRDLETDPF